VAATVSAHGVSCLHRLEARSPDTEHGFASFLDPKREKSPFWSLSSTSVIFAVFRAQDGKIAELNRRRCPVSGSTRRSLTRGAIAAAV
jgi:hypothetical protein